MQPSVFLNLLPPRYSTPRSTPPNNTNVSTRQHRPALCCVHIKQLAQTGMAAHHRDNVMANERSSNRDPSEPMVYQIRIMGHLGSEWSDWFEGLSITLQDNGETLLTGPVVDQAALHGLLRKVRDLGMVLISVICIQPGQADAIGSRYAAEKGDPPLKQC